MEKRYVVLIIALGKYIEWESGNIYIFNDVPDIPYILSGPWVLDWSVKSTHGKKDALRLIEKYTKDDFEIIEVTKDNEHLFAEL